eukprot:1195226-Prorocentrum_minimum.AAC.6
MAQEWHRMSTSVDELVSINRRIVQGGSLNGRPCGVCVEPYVVDLKGYGVDLKDCDVDLKGYGADLKILPAASSARTISELSAAAAAPMGYTPLALLLLMTPAGAGIPARSARTTFNEPLCTATLSAVSPLCGRHAPAR